jgi:hypothetical protein
MEKVRILRVLEYIGTREDIEKAYKHSGVPLNGIWEHGTLTIKSTIVDPFPEVVKEEF